MSGDSELENHVAKKLKQIDAHKMGGLKSKEALTALAQISLRDADDLPDLRVDYPATVVSGEAYFSKNEKSSGEKWVLIKEVKLDATKVEIKEFQDFQRALLNKFKISAQYLNTEATKHKSTTFGPDVGQLSILIKIEDWTKLHKIAGMETMITADSPVGTQQLSAGVIKTLEVDTPTTTMTEGKETPEGARIGTVVVTAPSNVLDSTTIETTIAR